MRNNSSINLKNIENQLLNNYFVIEITDILVLEDVLKTHLIKWELVSKTKVGEKTHYTCKIFCDDVKKSFWLGMAYNSARSDKSKLKDNSIFELK